MISAVLLFLFIIADIQLLIIYRDKLKGYERSKNESALRAARRVYIAAMCMIILTLLMFAVAVARQFQNLLSFR